MQATPTAEEAPPTTGRVDGGQLATPAAGSLTLALAHAARVPPAQRAAAIRSLSRSVGNAAVARAATRRVARYEAGEHSSSGGPGKTLKVGNTDITEGELQAMGEHPKDPEAMVADAKANPKAFENLRNKIRDDEKLRVQGEKEPRGEGLDRRDGAPSQGRDLPRACRQEHLALRSRQGPREQQGHLGDAAQTRARGGADREGRHRRGGHAQRLRGPLPHRRLLGRPSRPEARDHGAGRQELRRHADHRHLGQGERLLQGARGRADGEPEGRRGAREMGAEGGRVGGETQTRTASPR